MGVRARTLAKVPLMALLSEAFFKHTDTDWSIEGVKGSVPLRFRFGSCFWLLARHFSLSSAFFCFPPPLAPSLFLFFSRFNFPPLLLRFFLLILFLSLLHPRKRPNTDPDFLFLFPLLSCPPLLSPARPRTQRKPGRNPSCSSAQTLPSRNSARAAGALGRCTTSSSRACSKGGMRMRARKRARGREESGAGWSGRRMSTGRGGSAWCRLERCVAFFAFPSFPLGSPRELCSWAFSSPCPL